MRLHAAQSIAIIIAIGSIRGILAQGAPTDESGGDPTAAAVADSKTAAAQPDLLRVEYENPIPEFLRGRDLPPVIAGRKIVTVPVTSANWVDLGWGDLVRVEIVRRVEQVLADDAAPEIQYRPVTLVESAAIYAISSFAPSTHLTPVCLSVSPEEARKCMEASPGDDHFRLTVVRKHQSAVVDEPADPLTLASGDDNESTLRADPLAAGPSNVDAKPPIELRQIELAVDGSGVITHTSPIARLQVADGSVAFVRPIDDYQLDVTGRGPGTTTVTFYDVHDVELTVKVRVKHDDSELQQILERLYPDAKIEVIRVQNAILLRGVVADGTHVEEVIEIAEQFVPQVLNQLRTSDGREDLPATEAMQIPAGLRVITVSPSKLNGLLEPGHVVDVFVTYQRRLQNGNLQLVTKTAVTRCKVFAVDRFGGTVSLLCTPRAVNLVKFAETKGTVGLVLRALDDAGEFEIGVPIDGLVDELAGLADASEGTASAQTTPAEAPDESSEDLRSDLRALHEDVRRLIEILEQRAEEPQEEAGEGAAVLENGMLFFFAVGSEPCREVWPSILQIAKDGRRVHLVNVDLQPDVAKRYEVSSVPAFVVSKDGKVVGRTAGAMTAEQLLDLYSVGVPEPPVSRLEPGAIQRVLGSLLHPLHRGSSPLAFDFPFSIQNQPADDERKFSFYVGMTR